MKSPVVKEKIFNQKYKFYRWYELNTFENKFYIFEKIINSILLTKVNYCPCALIYIVGKNRENVQIQIELFSQSQSSFEFFQWPGQSYRVKKTTRNVVKYLLHFFPFFSPLPHNYKIEENNKGGTQCSLLLLPTIETLYCISNT